METISTGKVTITSQMDHVSTCKATITGENEIQNDSTAMYTQGSSSDSEEHAFFKYRKKVSIMFPFHLVSRQSGRS